MTAPLKTVETATDIAGLMHGIGQRARAAARILALAPAAQKGPGACRHGQGASARATADILAANAGRMSPRRKAAGATEAFLDRLALDEQADRGHGRRPRRRARACRPGRHRHWTRWTRPNGMTIERVRVPLGVVGVIYESRPNVTADAGALCLKAGNAVILRGGSDSFRSSRAIHAALAAGPARRPACPRTRSSWCRRATAPRSA